MANWSNPALTSTYTNFLNDLKARDEDLAKQFDGQTTSNLPVGAIRWSSSLNRWQKWSGTAWDPLTQTYALTGLSTTGNAAIGGTLSVTGVSQLAAGTAAAPGLAIGEATTGMFRPGAGILGFATGGAEAFRVDSVGRFGLGFAGTLGDTAGAFRVNTSITGGVTANGVVVTSPIATDVTTRAMGLLVQPGTADGISGLTELRVFSTGEGVITGGTRGAVVNQYGFFAAPMTGATNNFGFYSNIASAVGRWNYFANGTAPNYFAGDVRSNTVFSRTVSDTPSNTTTTASASSLRGGLRTGTPTGAINLLVPTGSNMDAAFQDLQVNQAFEWNVINLAAATHAITVVANTDHTVVGSMVVAANSSGRFLTRKSAANTFITYRIA